MSFALKPFDGDGIEEGIEEDEDNDDEENNDEDDDEVEEFDTYSRYDDDDESAESNDSSKDDDRNGSDSENQTLYWESSAFGSSVDSFAHTNSSQNNELGLSNLELSDDDAAGEVGVEVLAMEPVRPKGQATTDEGVLATGVQEFDNKADTSGGFNESKSLMQQNELFDGLGYTPVYGGPAGGLPETGSLTKNQKRNPKSRQTAAKELYGDGAGLGSTMGSSRVNRRKSFSNILAGNSGAVRNVGTPVSTGTGNRRNGTAASMANVSGPGDSGSGGGGEGRTVGYRTRRSMDFRKAALRGSGSKAGSDASSGAGTGISTIINTEAAIMKLDNAATEWEGVAAAAAVVAGSVAAGTNTRHHRRFGVGDKVLVYLSVLNHTLGHSDNASSSVATPAVARTVSDVAVSTSSPVRVASPSRVSSPGRVASPSRVSSPDPDAQMNDLMERSTICPVNKYGYPLGQGRTEEEKKGPHVFVLAEVKKVHFEEDARYYTVTRADTETNQRADTEWMEPLLNAEGERAAFRAAQITRYSTAKRLKQTNKDKKSDREKCRMYSPLWRVLLWVCRCFHNVIGRRVMACYTTGQRVVKEQAAKFLYGNSPYSCLIQVTAINFLVLCSLLFMFIDQLKLAFLPVSADFAVAVVECVVWLVLVVELLFEVMIRPDGYSTLSKSEKAYAPSTARFINVFHLLFETLALLLFVPELRNLSASSRTRKYPYSLTEASLNAILGPGFIDVFLGYLFYASIRLRIFGAVRHWKKMWINHTFEDKGPKKPGYFYGFFVPESKANRQRQRLLPTVMAKRKVKVDNEPFQDQDDHNNKDLKKKASEEEDIRLNKAATIGTALMVVNSHRAMILLVIIVGVIPLLYSFAANGGRNVASKSLTLLLQENNLMVPGDDEDSCDYLKNAISSWLFAAASLQLHSSTQNASKDNYLLWAQVLPVRCEFQDSSGMITRCPKGYDRVEELCYFWNNTTDNSTAQYLAHEMNLRVGAVSTYSSHTNQIVNGQNRVFNTTAMFNQERTIHYATMLSFFLQASMLLAVLAGLTVLRGDAGLLVIHPLRRMLKIVLRYAANPLSPNPAVLNKSHEGGRGNDGGSDSDFDADDKDKLGNYETEQLITAIAKITDLLRKCWGVAGAGIISANLARNQDGNTVVFNPTVPGKLVYALFGFAGINDFSHLLRALDQDVMILINDVARVVHNEIFRWGLGDSGQCNKNLGAAFLMVYRIGDFKEVHEKKEKATDVIFSSVEKRGVKKSTMLKRRNQTLRTKSRLASKRAVIGRKQESGELAMDTLQLASLPGISAFTDRALIGMLKSFAGIHRDKSLVSRKNDFRLGAGVGAFSVDMIFGMDAGWAVEGAVGSEYKIDATYLSPHVNMASRMMSACKQYGVSILLSQAVEELLSEPARKKLRHLDTVTVKGSSLKQRIFTYDARHIGVDFFLHERSPEQADLDSEQYTPNIWHSDQDLKAMRNHVTEEFDTAFKEGRTQYLAGNWPKAIEKLEEANNIMIQTVLDEGYHEYDVSVWGAQIMNSKSKSEEVIRLRQELGDGGCQSLLSYMEKEEGVAPKHWRGVRPLTSK